MTDPRIAALAEALNRSGLFVSQAFADDCPDHTMLGAEDAAAAILAALPADWCGHRPADLLRELDLVQRLAKADYNLARLRRIEEAARDLIYDSRREEPGVRCDHSALRAALEEKR